MGDKLGCLVQSGQALRLDNTIAGVLMVYPLLLGNHMTDYVDLYIK